MINAIGSKRKIILKPGIYDLSGIKQINSSDGSVTWKQVSDGKELNISNVTDLILEGSSNAVSEIRTLPRYANILRFNNVRRISIKNITTGHTPAEYMCDAGVIYFDHSSDIEISGSSFYGCGSVSIQLYHVNNFSANDTEITHCSLRALDIANVENVRFTGCIFKNNEAYSNIIFANAAKKFHSAIVLSLKIDI